MVYFDFCYREIFSTNSHILFSQQIEKYVPHSLCWVCQACFFVTHCLISFICFLCHCRSFPNTSSFMQTPSLEPNLAVELAVGTICSAITFPQQRSDLLANIGEGKLRNWSSNPVRNWHNLTGKPAFVDPCEWVLASAGRTGICFWKYLLIDCSSNGSTSLMCSQWHKVFTPTDRFLIHDYYLFIYWFHPSPDWRLRSCCHSLSCPQIPVEECEHKIYSEIFGRQSLEYIKCQYIVHIT